MGHEGERYPSAPLLPRVLLVGHKLLPVHRHQHLPPTLPPHLLLESAAEVHDLVGLAMALPGVLHCQLPLNNAQVKGAPPAAPAFVHVMQH